MPFLRVSASLRQIVILSLAASLLPAQPPSAERQLEAAIHREIVLGDLAGAMEQYRAILSHSGAARPVAARALLQIGECQEKLGHRVEADIAYRRVVADFSDQSDLVTQARMELAAWSGPRNLKFEEGVPGKLPPGWFVPSLPKDADYLAELRRVGCHSGVGCAVVMVPVNVPKPLGNLMQNFSAAAYQGKTVRLRAWLKVEAYYPTATSLRVPDPAGEDRAQMWISVERPNRRNGFSDNMDDRPVRSSEWTRCEIVGEIDDDAQFINIGVMSIGGGRVWVDDVSFEVVPKSASK